jgi:hypothetical protein
LEYFIGVAAFYPTIHPLTLGRFSIVFRVGKSLHREVSDA